MKLITNTLALFGLYVLYLIVRTAIEDPYIWYLIRNLWS